MKRLELEKTRRHEPSLKIYCPQSQVESPLYKSRSSKETFHIKSEKVRKPRSRIVRFVGPIKSVPYPYTGSGLKGQGENDNDDRNDNGNDNEIAVMSTFAEYLDNNLLSCSSAGEVFKFRRRYSEKAVPKHVEFRELVVLLATRWACCRSRQATIVSLEEDSNSEISGRILD